MVKKLRCSWRSFVVAALLSALASTLIVAVGPGFSSPNDNAAEQAEEATGDTGASQVASTESTEEVTEVITTEATEDRQPHNPDVENPNASSVPDTHGHVGSGTGTTTGSQADPGHKGDDFKPEDGNSNGPGTGDEDAPTCPNDKSSVNGDVDNGNGGANGSGPYDSTCDGDNSENGQGTAAPGKGTPCAGCVGNADDKQPPGQVKEFNGQKPNDMGYECDGNQGVGAHYGRGNPAHTGDCGTAPPPECPDDMNPFEEGKQCTPPPCPTDMDEEEEGLQCEAPTKVEVCHKTGNGYSIHEVRADKIAQWLATHPDDIYPVPSNGVAGCVEPPPCPTDMDEEEEGVQCEEPTRVEVCHKTGNHYTIHEVRTDQLAHWLSIHPEDKYPVPSTGVAGCATAPPPPDCNGDNIPENNHTCLPVVCPSDSDMPGLPVPGDDVRNCYITPPPVCPSDSNMPGLPVPGGDVRNCYILPPPPLCPAGSDKAGQPMPGGDIRRCYNDTPPPTVVCPAGTDRAGQPMPNGDIRNCNDDVLGEVIDKDKPGDGDVLGNRDGAAERPATRGRILPFTGASLLAYLVLALELLGAGALILRARKR